MNWKLITISIIVFLVAYAMGFNAAKRACVYVLDNQEQ